MNILLLDAGYIRRFSFIFFFFFFFKNGCSCRFLPFSVLYSSFCNFYSLKEWIWRSIVGGCWKHSLKTTNNSKVFFRSPFHLFVETGYSFFSSIYLIDFFHFEWMIEENNWNKEENNPSKTKWNVKYGKVFETHVLANDLVHNGTFQ